MPAVQLPLFCTPAPSPAVSALGVATTPELDALLALQPAVALNCSGGKDGACAALAAMRYLDMVGHKGPRLCVHADLGSVEWQDSLPMCRELADRLGLELLVVRRGKGGLMQRWRTRWSGNIARYRDLKCATLIMPWSSAKWRYCTSELKAAPIASALKRRFPNRPTINVTGIRRQESAARAAKPVVAIDKRLARKVYAGLVWHPIIEFLVADVWAALRAAGMRPHVAYQIYNASRVSCAFCVLAKLADLQAGARCPDNHAVYVEMVELEAVSTFSFQSGRWLADVAPWLLDADLRARVALAKKTAQERERLAEFERTRAGLTRQLEQVRRLDGGSAA